MTSNTVSMLMIPKFILQLRPCLWSCLLCLVTYQTSQTRSLRNLACHTESPKILWSSAQTCSSSNFPVSVNGISTHLVSRPKPREIHFDPFVSLTFHIPSIAKSCQFSYRYFVDLFLSPVPPAQHTQSSLLQTTLVSQLFPFSPVLLPFDPIYRGTQSDLSVS